jgi:hypothetical protein
MIMYGHSTIADDASVAAASRAIDAAMSDQELSLSSKTVGALPIINRIIDQLDLEQMIDRFVCCTDKRRKLAPRVGIGMLVRNILIAREPLYGAREWAGRFEQTLLGLPERGAQLLNDDRVGRCLDSLFAADRAALMSAVGL